MTLSRFFEKVEAEAAGKEMKRHNADDPTVREVSPCRVFDDEDPVGISAVLGDVTLHPGKRSRRVLNVRGV